jgi:hypothetical protein
LLKCFERSQLPVMREAQSSFPALRGTVISDSFYPMRGRTPLPEPLASSINLAQKSIYFNNLWTLHGSRRFIIFQGCPELSANWHVSHPMVLLSGGGARDRGAD